MSGIDYTKGLHTTTPPSPAGQELPLWNRNRICRARAIDLRVSMYFLPIQCGIVVGRVGPDVSPSIGRFSLSKSANTIILYELVVWLAPDRSEPRIHKATPFKNTQEPPLRRFSVDVSRPPVLGAHLFLPPGSFFLSNEERKRTPEP